jgi:Na+-driven multidrug efflux pump
MGFTFPVVMIVGALSSGISMGAGSILARALRKKGLSFNG